MSYTRLSQTQYNVKQPLRRSVEVTARKPMAVNANSFFQSPWLSCSESTCL